jgi:hypothetical protein
VGAYDSQKVWFGMERFKVKSQEGSGAGNVAQWQSASLLPPTVLPKRKEKHP